MLELNMSIYTGPDNATVTLTAKFANHQKAVAFHEDLAALCRQHSSDAERKAMAQASWPRRLGWVTSP